MATSDLRQHLRKAIFVSLAPYGPLDTLVQSALNGDVVRVEKHTRTFAHHAEKIIKVAGLVQNTSADTEDEKKLARAIGKLQALYPQVINAAQLLAANSTSAEARDNLEAFMAAWLRSLDGVMKAVDNFTNIVDFLAVTKAHVLDDIKKCVVALQDRDAGILADSAMMVQGRSNRVCVAVLRDLTHYHEDVYTECVREGVNVLRSALIPQFEALVASSVQKIGDGKEITDVDVNEFIDASRLVYDRIRDIQNQIKSNECITQQ